MIEKEGTLLNSFYEVSIIMIPKAKKLKKRNLQTNTSYKNICREFPGGPVVKNPTFNSGDAGSTTGWGTKIPHATGQLSPSTTTTEFACLSERARMPQLQSPRSQEPTCRKEKEACTLQRKIVNASMKIRHAATKT